MGTSEVSSAAGIAYACIAVIALSSVNAIVRLAKRPFRVKVPNEKAIYEDKDGAATEESMARYSAKTQFVVIFVAAAVGLLESFAMAVVATVWQKEYMYSDLSVTQAWLLFPSWVSICVCCL